MIDQKTTGLYESAAVKTQTLKTAIESACLLLRVDECVRLFLSSSVETCLRQPLTLSLLTFLPLYVNLSGFAALSRQNVLRARAGPACSKARLGETEASSSSALLYHRKAIFPSAVASRARLVHLDGTGVFSVHQKLAFVVLPQGKKRLGEVRARSRLLQRTSSRSFRVTE